MGFSAFVKPLNMGHIHFTVVENTLNKAAAGTWLEWFTDLRDKRDMSNYLKARF